jgi:predicted ABC-type ATPase
MSDKKLLIFAGPNGSGKSSTISSYSKKGQMPERYICPDLIVKQEPFSKIKDEREKYIEAMTFAEELRKSLILEGKSFAFETVFSTRGKLDFIDFAKKNDFEVETVFITTENPKINVERVNHRASTGGHPVPEDKIYSRYEKSMGMLPEIIKHSDIVKVYDNSGLKPELVFSKDREGKMFYYDNKWIKSAVVKPFREEELKVEKFINHDKNNNLKKIFNKVFNKNNLIDKDIIKSIKKELSEITELEKGVCKSYLSSNLRENLNNIILSTNKYNALTETSYKKDINIKLKEALKELEKNKVLMKDINKFSTKESKRRNENTLNVKKVLNNKYNKKEKNLKKARTDKDLDR